ncbi:hypothetical protein KDA_55650 [Dictyobacter alpinus]|uniref:Uncharacterized protein n=1 Tax=Dictyobacter alpinus TaxID=2014873 RepID=A0A402BFA1_9CHLR|nr:hypothetical protein [Dictyobacter alpinus]GCE30081.1 hypothetical protein KDA_55650 [Dictyobacter alpinus]
MTPDQLTTAIVNGVNAGGEQFLEGTLAATLPIIWLAILGLHLGRPYILDMIDRFTLRLGADLLWLIYIALRDILIISGVIMSFMFLFPDVVTTDQLPLTGGLAAVCLFAVLLIKLMGDPDHNLRDFRLTTYLLGLGALFYFVPYVIGVQANAVTSGTIGDISKFLVTSSNTSWAIGIGYVTIVLLAIMGAIAAGYTLRTGGLAEAATETPDASAKK